MNIGIITTWFERGAAHVSKAYMNVLKQEHNVYIYARGGEMYAKGDPNWDLDNVTWETPVLGKPYLYINWEEFKTWMANYQIDILLFNEQIEWDILLRLCTFDIPFGAYIDYYTLETYPFFGLYDFVICNTQRHFSVFKDHPQAYFIPWGTDINLYKPRENPEDLRPLTFFHSCGMNPNRKGTELLVKAFSALKQNASLIIHSQLPLKDHFPGLYRKIIRDKRIQLIEEVSEPPGFYHLGDVYVYPSILDGIGLTIAEALACGLPVITTNEPPMNEFIEDNKNGKLVDVAYYKRREDKYYWKQSFCNVDSLHNRLEEFVQNRDQLEYFQENARHYALEKLDWSKNGQKLNKILPEIKMIHKGSEQSELFSIVQKYENRKIQAYSRYWFFYSVISRIKRIFRSLLDWIVGLIIK